MIRIQLPQPEVERLQEVFQTTQDRKLRDRVQIVLMAHRGRARHDIATDLGIHRRRVTRWLNAYCDAGLQALRALPLTFPHPRWLNAYCDAGLQGLRPRKARGNAAKIPASLADDIRRWVLDGPAGQGLDRANWTHEEIADHLDKAKGIRTSRSAVQRFCQKIDIRLYRPTYRYLRGDPDEQARAKEDIAGLKKKRRRARSSC